MCVGRSAAIQPAHEGRLSRRQLLLLLGFHIEFVAFESGSEGAVGQGSARFAFWPFRGLSQGIRLIKVNSNCSLKNYAVVIWE